MQIPTTGFRRSLSILVVLALALFTVRPTLAQDGPPLSAEEIVALLAGNTIKGTGYSIYYSPDGTMRGKEGSYKDKGKWTAEGDLFCTRWSKWAQGKELCWKLRKKGKEIHREGVVNAKDNVVKWHEGNVDSL